MLLSTLVLSLLTVVSAAPSEYKAKKPQPTFSRNVIFTPPSNNTDPRVLYARSAQFEDGTLVATWENYTPEPPPVYFPIYKSTDGGLNWKEISRVQDTANGLGLRYQPTLYVLPKKIGGFKKGTLLLSGSSIPTDLSTTQIELYASKDKGVTWEFVSHIAAGGEARPNNGLTPVWEPYLMVYKNTLICYYSDQRDPKYGQKMVHQQTKDLKNWGPVVDDVTEDVYTQRPGMPIVTKLPNNKYIMTYEFGGGPQNVSSNYLFPLYYKIVDDPTKFNDAEGIPLIATDGTVPTGSPYNAWSPVGGKNGTLIASAHNGEGTDANGSEIYINKGLGHGPWIRVPTPEGSSYTREIKVLNDPSKLLIIGGGQLPPSTTNQITVTVMDISKL
jgi:hypothetical protein